MKNKTTDKHESSEWNMKVSRARVPSAFNDAIKSVPDTSFCGKGDIAAVVPAAGAGKAT